MTPISDLHARLRTARRDHQRAEFVLASLLWELRRTRAYADRGHANVEQYAEVELDLGVRQVRDLIAIGRRLGELPALARAFADGQLGWTKAREVVRVATPETDSAWTSRAVVATNRDLERQVSAARPGEPPPAEDTWRAGPARVRLSLELDAAQAETLGAALVRLRHEGGFGPDAGDGLLLVEMARAALLQMDTAAEASGAPAAERYRITVRHCPTCERAHVGDRDATPEVLAEAACDAERLEKSGVPLSHVVPPATRRRVLERHGHRCAVPHCRNRLWVDLHHIRPRSLGGTHTESNLCPLCPTHHRLTHEGRLIVLVVDGALQFALPTGEIFGLRHDTISGAPGMAAVTARVAETVGWGGRIPREVSRRSGLDPATTATALGVLHAAGTLLESPDGTWHAAERLLPARPTWVSPAVRPVEGRRFDAE